MLIILLHYVQWNKLANCQLLMLNHLTWMPELMGPYIHYNYLIQTGSYIIWCKISAANSTHLWWWDWHIFQRYSRRLTFVVDALLSSDTRLSFVIEQQAPHLPRYIMSKIKQYLFVAVRCWLRENNITCIKNTSNVNVVEQITQSWVCHSFMPLSAV